MIVICAGTTGFDTMVDVRYLWYLQKRYQGSHLFNDEQAAAFNDLVREGRCTTTLGHTYDYGESGLVHQLMGEGALPEGNVAVLVNAPRARADRPALGAAAPARARPARRPVALGWTNAIVVPRDPGRGVSSISADAPRPAGARAPPTMSSTR